MSQSVVTIRLNGTPYQIGCGAGEEAHIESLAADIEEVLQSLVASVGQIGESRLLAMTALILADRAHDDRAHDDRAHDDRAHEGGAAASTGAGDGEVAAAAALERSAERILALASKLSSA